METWWQGLPMVEKLFWGIAVLFTFLFLLQTILSFVSGGDDGASGEVDDAMGHDDGVGSSFFTIKNFIAFFTMFGWVGLASLYNGLGGGAAITLGALAGILLVAIMMWLLNKAGQMRHSGTLDLRNAVGLAGSTYLVIPPARGGLGKLTVRVQGSLRELDAMTDDAAPIATGSVARVVGLLDGRILLVTRNS